MQYIRADMSMCVKVVRVLKGPVPMRPANVEDDGPLPEGLLRLWSEVGRDL